jgi:alpha-1,6-mannosyltransferase
MPSSILQAMLTKHTILLALCYLIGLVAFSLKIDRADTWLVLAAYASLFLLYALLLRQPDVWSVRQILGLAVVLRLAVCFVLPWLSDDFYRFLWDGQMGFHGIHPFAYTPEMTEVRGEPYQLLNSKQYFTVYPAVCQLVFFLSAFGKFCLQSTLIIRAFLLTAEIGTVYLLARHTSSPKALWYAANPLVIIEICGNLHFEGLAIFFLTLVMVRMQSIINAAEKRTHGATLGSVALFWTLSIATKLTPLLLAPLFFAKLEVRQWFKFGLASAVSFLFLFLPIGYKLEYLQHMGQSLDLYFRDFQLNASVFYVIHRAIYVFSGQNAINTIGPLLSLLTISLVFFLAQQVWKRKLDLGSAIVWAFLVHLFLSTTVHPWYVLMPFALSFFADDNRLLPFTTVWTALVVLSYSHYGGGVYAERFAFIIVEYAALALAWLACTRHKWSE